MELNQVVKVPNLEVGADWLNESERTFHWSDSLPSWSAYPAVVEFWLRQRQMTGGFSSGRITWPMIKRLLRQTRLSAVKVWPERRAEKEPSRTPVARVCRIASMG